MSLVFFDEWFAQHQQTCGIVCCLDVSLRSCSESETEIEISCPSCGEAITGLGNGSLLEVLHSLKRHDQVA